MVVVDKKGLAPMSDLRVALAKVFPKGDALLNANPQKFLSK